MDQVFSTDALLRALKSSSFSNSNARGLWAEACVARQYLKSHSFLFHRLKTYLGEIDLGFVTKTGVIILVEVKTLSNRSLAETRLSRVQKRRLRNNYQYLLYHLNREIEFHYVLVSPDECLIVHKEGILD